MQLQAAPVNFRFRSLSDRSRFCLCFARAYCQSIQSRSFRRLNGRNLSTPRRRVVNLKCHSVTVTFAQRRREFISTVIQFRFRSVFSVFSLAAGTGSIGRSVDKSDLIDDLNSHSKFFFFFFPKSCLSRGWTSASGRPIDLWTLLAHIQPRYEGAAGADGLRRLRAGNLSSIKRVAGW